MSVPGEGHQRLDRRSLALHRAIADKLAANPALIAIARENLERWSLSRGRSQPYWDAWREILGQPMIATGGDPGSGLMPLLDWHEGIALFPKNPKVKAGARAQDLAVH